MINQDPLAWNGCRRNDKRKTRLGHPDTPDVPLKTWIKTCVPTFSQTTDDCVGMGWSNWLENMLREYVGMDAIPDGFQINGNAIWFKIKQMFYNGVLSGGAYVEEGFEALKELGWIPKDSMLVNVGIDWVSQGEALLETPLVVAHMVYPGWFTPNKENGCLDHVYDENRREGGHCTCRIGRVKQNEKNFFLGQNSWGEDWGWNGCFLMDEIMDLGTSLDSPYTVTIPGGFQRLRDIEGWKAGLISTPGATQQIRM